MKFPFQIKLSPALSPSTVSFAMFVDSYEFLLIVAGSPGVPQRSFSRYTKKITSLTEH